MSKSLKRVIAALRAAGLPAEVLEMPNSTRTATEAASAANCDVDQIAKSIIFQGETSGEERRPHPASPLRSLTRRTAPLPRPALVRGPEWE